jgi:sulfate permease, SulP family
MRPDGGRRSSLWRLLPFLAWFPLAPGVLRADMIAGITGALVLVPKAMAYAQLSGLPVHYGLYVALVPAIVGALWGSSAQLATGPVAVLSLMTAAALTPWAVPFSDHYIELALLLTLMVGVTQLLLGVLKLGVIVNFVSHPVILGFMNAAAIIIALSQLDLLFGISRGRSGSFALDTWEALTLLPLTHLPTLAMSAFALALMLGLKRIPRLSQMSVLIAVAVTILVSAAIGYERKARERIDQVDDAALRELFVAYDTADRRLAQINNELPAQGAQVRRLERSDPRAAVAARHDLALLELEAAELLAERKALWRQVVRVGLLRVEGPDGAPAALLPAHRPADAPAAGGHVWRIKAISGGELHLSGGGEVVGSIPRGLPAPHVPAFSLDAFVALLPAALVMALVGFMESIAMAKALAGHTRQRLVPNQELIGQGAANLAGSFFQSYPACGSFTGSAINLQAGARTGMAMVFNSLFVAATLLLLTPLLYHLPKATLGAIILLAVISLFTPTALRNTWRASRSDGIVAGATFVATLVLAPHLDQGIALGAALAVLLYLLRTMRPRLSELGRHPDGALRDIRVYPELQTTPELLVLRFDDSLFFANAAFFEDQVLEAVARRPQLKYVLITGGGINQMDASGEEVVRHLVERLRGGGVTVVFSGLKKQVLDVVRRTGLVEAIGADCIFANDDLALAEIYRRLGREGQGELLARR